MAMCAPLEDMVTCPICQDIFQNPMALTCLHTLCRICILDLKKSSNNKYQVECPICREYSKIKGIKKDFKTQSLVEYYHMETKNTFHGVTYKMPCGICQKHKVSWNCEECQMNICDSCKVSHLQIPACSKHIIKEIEEVLHQKILTLKTLESKYQEIINFTKHKKDTLVQYCDIITNSEEKLHSEVDDFQNQIFETVEDFCMILKDQISTVVQGDNYPKAKDHLRKIQTVQDVIHVDYRHLSSIIANQEPSVILNSVDTIYKDYNSKLMTGYDVPSSVPTTSNQVDIKIKDMKHIHTFLGEMIRIHSPETVASGNITSESAINFEHWLSSKSIKKEQKIHCNDCNSIQFTNGKIWCLYDNKIVAYSKDGKFLKTISSIRNGRAVLCVNNHLLVASAGYQQNESGLSLYNLSGSFVKQLAKGRFIAMDILPCKPQMKIATLEYGTGEIKVFLIVTNKDSLGIECISSVKPELELSMFDTIATLNTSHFMVASFCFDCVTKYTDDCEKVAKYDNNQDEIRIYKFKNPRLCCSDGNNKIVLLNFGSPEQPPFVIDNTGRLISMNHPIFWNKENTMLVQAPNEVKCLDVSADDANNLWILQTKSQPSILGLGQYFINKYTIENKPSWLEPVLIGQIVGLLVFLIAAISFSGTPKWICSFVLMVNVLFVICVMRNYHVTCKMYIRLTTKYLSNIRECMMSRLNKHTV